MLKIGIFEGEARPEARALWSDKEIVCDWLQSTDLPTTPPLAMPEETADRLKYLYGLPTDDQTPAINLLERVFIDLRNIRSPMSRLCMLLYSACYEVGHIERLNPNFNRLLDDWRMRLGKGQPSATKRPDGLFGGSTFEYGVDRQKGLEFAAGRNNPDILDVPLCILAQRIGSNTLLAAQFAALIGGLREIADKAADQRRN